METHLQKIFETHYSGALISLTKSRGKLKKQTVTALVTIPLVIVQAEPLLQEALSSDRGVPITLPPLSKVYFRKKKENLTSNESSIVALQKRVNNLEITIRQLKADHVHELNSLRQQMAKNAQAQKEMGKSLAENGTSLTRICEFIRSLQSSS